MNAEYLLEAIGLLDDDLIQEAERAKRPNYGKWIAWAASLALVITLGYRITHIGMGGASSNTSGGGMAGAASNSVSNGGMDEPLPESPEGSNGDLQGVGSLPGDWLFALRVDGTVYWATEEYFKLEPEEGDIRYTTSFSNTSEPEEDGQANFLPVGRAYVVLDDGTVAVLQEDTGSWRVYDSIPPWEK